jgi:lysozyme
MGDTDYEKLLNQLIRLEGSKLAPYADVEGRLIVADARYAESAGVGGRTVTVLEADVRRVAGELRDQWPGFGALDAVRQRVVVHMAFSMRVTGLLAMDRLVAALEMRLWEKAAEEILISHWAKREKRRALVLAEMMQTGRDEMSAFRPRRA